MYLGCHGIILLLIPRAEISACSLGLLKLTSYPVLFADIFPFKKTPDFFVKLTPSLLLMKLSSF